MRLATESGRATVQNLDGKKGTERQRKKVTERKREREVKRQP